MGVSYVESNRHHLTSVGRIYLVSKILDRFSFKCEIKAWCSKEPQGLMEI